eukprot:8236010-Pyramimonas_sp.AAC.1
MWWHVGRREDWSWIQIPGSQRVSTQYLFGDGWLNAPFMQFALVTDEEARQARRQTPGVSHVGGMDDTFDHNEGYINHRWNGIKRSRSIDSDDSGNPAPHLARRLDDEAPTLKRQLSLRSDGSGNPGPHVSPKLDDETPEEQCEDMESENDFWHGL